MMAKKGRFPAGYSGILVPQYELEGLDSSDLVDYTEDSSAITRKRIDLSYASKDAFAVPIETIPLARLSLSERKNLCLRLTAEREQIRLLKNKVETQNQRNIGGVAMSSSNDMLCRNGAIQKGRGFTRGIAGKLESGLHSGSNAHAVLLKQCESLLKKLMLHKHAWVFNEPVDVVTLKLYDYFDIIKNPMDLGTIKNNLASGKYQSPMEFLSDVRLTFSNAKTYNPPASDVHFMANTMSQLFESRWRNIEKKIPANANVSLAENFGNFEHTEVAKSMAHLKKRKLSPTMLEVKPDSAKRKMTGEERQKIGRELEDLMEDLPRPIEDFIRASCSNGDNGSQDEIELDIDILSDDVLFTLRKLLDDHMLHKKKSFKSEACEIELPNVSGLSHSSLQVDQENCDIDEDVDIGGNESPDTSYPPLVIEKDTCVSDEEHVEAASVGELDHIEHDLTVNLSTTRSDGRDGETAHAERQVSPDKLYRAALLKNRFADTILKAREKALIQDEKGDPEKIRREREIIELQKKREKARLQAEAKAAEDARRRAEEEAEAEAKKKRELEREAARLALLKMEKTVEIENSRFLEDLEMLRVVVPGEQLLGSMDETSPEQSQDGQFGNFKFVGSNALEQLGLYMKRDDAVEEEEVDID